eukprot:snap_masked-scaffold_1-processed-gene-9.49-mRNA-1 protein AED:1.00 eAED:1.00 QI:0/-1/0/0/-1/1/1/0/222
MFLSINTVFFARRNIFGAFFSVLTLKEYSKNREYLIRLHVINPQLLRGEYPENRLNQPIIVRKFTSDTRRIQSKESILSSQYSSEINLTIVRKKEEERMENCDQDFDWDFCLNIPSKKRKTVPKENYNFLLNETPPVQTNFPVPSLFPEDSRLDQWTLKEKVTPDDWKFIAESSEQSWETETAIEKRDPELQGLIEFYQKATEALIPKGNEVNKHGRSASFY